MDLALAHPLTNVGTTSGTLTRAGRQWQWQTSLTNVSLPNTNQNDLAPLRRLEVNITWTEGQNQKNYHLTTYVANK
jgi:hypothetical protein